MAKPKIKQAPLGGDVTRASDSAVKSAPRSPVTGTLNLLEKKSQSEFSYIHYQRGDCFD